MNQIGEIIDYAEKTKSCRYLNPQELIALLKFDLVKFWSWGVNPKKFVIDNQKDCRMFRMNVNGHHHKGLVYIFVNGADLFDVYLTNYKGKIKDIGTDIYFEDLVDWIDQKIEKIDEYAR